jgi:hypothetical protein
MPLRTEALPIRGIEGAAGFGGDALGHWRDRPAFALILS